jgi:ABC-type glutathione transport system ATPase component
MTDRDNAQLEVASPGALRKRCDRLLWHQQQDAKQLASERAKLAQIDEYLAIAPAVDDALDKLSEAMFGSLTRVIEEQLTVALQEVLDQPDLRLKVEREFKRGAATMRFHVERNGNREDIMRGQGGSVANVLSVGLRLFALTTLDEQKHRRFLVLDEQDCWLRPDLVPALVKMVRDAGRALGFQVIMISHHDLGIFERYADRVYRFIPCADGVKVECAVAPPTIADPA